MNGASRGLVLLVPMLAAVAFSWARIVAETDDVPRDEDYAAASALVREGFDPARDALVILPPWSLRPLRQVADLAPISGDAVADRPLHRWGRLWAIVEPDADDDRSALVARRGPPSFSRAVGRVHVERWDLPPPSVTFDLAARLADAQVRVAGDPSRADPACAPVGSSGASAGAGAQGGWRCGDAHWQRVRREWQLVSENADLAVFAHPPAKGARLELEWPAVPMGAVVVVTAGFTRDGAGSAKAPVRVRVLVDGELAGTVVRRPAFSFATDVIDTTRFAGRTATLTLAIDSDDNAGAHFAFDAYVVAPPGTP